MESKIIRQMKNPFLHREEYVLEIGGDVNPSFDEVKKIVGKEEGLTVVKKVGNNFGRNVYASERVIANPRIPWVRYEDIIARPVFTLSLRWLAGKDVFSFKATDINPTAIK